MIKIILFFCFILVPVLDIYLFFLFSSMVGFLFCILEIVISGVLGIYIFRQNYQSLFKNFSFFENNISKVSQINQTSKKLIFCFLGSILVLIPGFLSDVFGLLLLFFPIQKAISLILFKFLKKYDNNKNRFYKYEENNNFFEGEYYDITEEKNILSKNKEGQSSK